jgi:asparagine synthetase B (glutamine-hydrolysing)
MKNVQLLRELYLEHGLDCLSQLDGYFACTIIDSEKFVLARDPIGVRSLFYGPKIENDEFYFASEGKALKDFLPGVNVVPPVTTILLKMIKFMLINPLPLKYLILIRTMQRKSVA